MKVNSIDNHISYRGAHFDKGVKEIIDNTPNLPTNFLRDMFGSYLPDVPILFKLNKDNQITATNLFNEQICPRKCDANGVSLNNLMGELLNQRTYYHKTFWHRNPNYKITHSKSEEKDIYTINKINSYYIPYKKITIDKNSEITIERQLENGFNILTKETGEESIPIRISHKDLIRSLYDNSLPYSGVTLSEYTIEYYQKLPDNLKHHCFESLKKLSGNLLV